MAYDDPPHHEHADGRPVVGVGCVVWKEGQVLLVRRAKPPLQGKWSIPGGGQKLGETVAQTALREVREETGLDVKLIGLIDVVDAIIPSDDGSEPAHYTLVDFSALWQQGTAIAGDDATEVVWTAPDQLAGFELWSETERVILKSRDILLSEGLI